MHSCRPRWHAGRSPRGTGGFGALVTPLNEQPGFALALAAHAHQCEPPLQSRAMQDEAELAGLDSLGKGAGRVEVLVRPVVPDRNFPGPVLALGDGAAEVRVGERVVLDPDRQPLDRRV